MYDFSPSSSFQDSLILRSYNAHNDYILGLTAFNSLHEEFYTKQLFDMLDELQVLWDRMN